MDQWPERYRGILFFGLIVLALAALVLFQVLRPSSQPIILSTSTPLPTPDATPTPHPLRVYVSGAVQHPDVYTLPPDSIVKDAMLAAGGPADDADLDRINLASPVADGQQIYVPRQGEGGLPVQPLSGQRSSDFRVNINTADAAALETLPGIGPALAQRILDYRQAHGPFVRVEDIMEVSGIGKATFEKLSDQITTE
ncbi:MAG: ComEA family DNA-binding protein [Anaerolineae bacterium]